MPVQLGRLFGVEQVLVLGLPHKACLGYVVSLHCSQLFVEALTMRLVAALLVFLLSACATTKPIYWNKPGATQNDFRHDQTECEVAAVRDVPVRESSTSIFAPTTKCSRDYFGSVKCSTDPGVSLKQDDNADLRKRAYIVCLERRGWGRSNNQESKERRAKITAPADTKHYNRKFKFGQYNSAVGGYCVADADCIRGLYCSWSKCVRERPDKPVPK